MKRIYQYIIMFMVGGMLVACGTDQEPIVEFETVPNINKETVYLDDWAGSSFQLLFASDNTLYFCEYSDVNYEQRFHAIASGATEAEAIPLVVENESGEAVLENDTGLLVTRHRIGNVTFWVKFTEDAEGYTVRRAYSHRMTIETR